MQAQSENQGDSVKVEQLSKTSCSWDGAKLPNYPTSAPEITVVKYTIPPHKKLSWHRHLVINCGIILHDELTVVAQNGMEKTFTAGESIVEMVGTAHYGENRGSEAVEIVMFYVGTKNLPLKEDVK